MLRLLSLLLLVFAVHPAFAQFTFETLSLDEALVKAGQQGKMVLVEFVDEDCRKCGEVIDITFSEPELQQLVGQRCVAIKIDPDHPGWASFKEEYNNIKASGTFIFSPHAQGDWIHAFKRVSTNPKVYISEINKAWEKQLEGSVSFAELEAEWNNNAGNIAAMEKMLTKRSALGWRLDSLLAVYITRLPADSLRSPRVRKLIFELAPGIFTQAYKLARQDKATWNHVWTTLTYQEKTAHIRKTIRKSMTTAIKRKNERMAKAVAAFASANTRSGGADTTSHAYLHHLLGYYLKVNDTTSFIRLAPGYFNRYYMPLNTRAFNRADSNAKRSGYAGSLYYGARFVYRVSTDTSLLQQAVEWTKKSLTLKETHKALDLYARLAYKLGNRQEALHNEHRALQLAADNRFYKQEYGKVLASMKAGEKIE